VLLRQTLRLSGVQRALSVALAPWRGGRAIHDPGKIVSDVATAVALGGDCLADLAVVRAQPGIFGPVASDPTVSRLVSTLAPELEAVLPAIRRARAQARATVWARRQPLGANPGPRSGGQVVVDIDATLITAHSDKENAAPTHKQGFWFAPMCAFVDHGEHGTGETLVAQLRPGSASPWNKTDHITVLDLALAQQPEQEQAQVLVRTDSGGCSKAFLTHITELRLEYSIGFPAHETVKTALQTIPAQAWRAAIDSDGHPRDGAQVAELTAWLPTPVRATRPGPQDWPPGMRVIARRERPHPGAQLRVTDHDGWRITCFATNTRGPGWPLDTLEVRHRQRARAEDRIRGVHRPALIRNAFAESTP